MVCRISAPRERHANSMRNSIAKFTAALVLFCASACGQTGIRNATSTREKNLPRPSRILIHDFAVNERDIIEYQGILRQQPSVKEPAERARLLAREVQDALAEELASGLRALGFETSRVQAGAVAGASEIVIAGEFLVVDEGNPLRRLAVGFGSGTSTLQSRAQVFQGSGARKLVEFTTHSDSGAMPGAVPTLGAGAVVQGSVHAGSVITHATVSGVRTYHSEVARMAGASGDQIARYLSEFFAAQGWIRSDQVRKARLAH